jgi:hypothetical protein
LGIKIPADRFRIVDARGDVWPETTTPMVDVRGSRLHPVFRIFHNRAKPRTTGLCAKSLGTIVPTLMARVGNRRERI